MRSSSTVKSALFSGRNHINSLRDCPRLSENRFLIYFILNWNGKVNSTSDFNEKFMEKTK